MVFCIECKHLKGYQYKNCEYPRNLEIQHDWEMKWKSYIHKPKWINQKNNCSWFEKKGK